MKFLGDFAFSFYARKQKVTQSFRQTAFCFSPEMNRKSNTQIKEKLREEVALRFIPNFILINVFFRAWQSMNKKRQKGMIKFCLLISKGMAAIGDPKRARKNQQTIKQTAHPIPPTTSNRCFTSSSGDNIIDDSSRQQQQIIEKKNGGVSSKLMEILLLFLYCWFSSLFLPVIIQTIARNPPAQLGNETHLNAGFLTFSCRLLSLLMAQLV